MIWTMDMEGWTILNTPLWRQDLGSQEHEADLVSHIPAQEASTPPENQEADGPEKHTLEQPAVTTVWAHRRAGMAKDQAAFTNAVTRSIQLLNGGSISHISDFQPFSSRGTHRRLKFRRTPENLLSFQPI